MPSTHRGWLSIKQQTWSAPQALHELDAQSLGVHEGEAK